ncbi:MarR family transcriptional regulator [Streptomyces pseudogriseolus]|uniref:MarR family transcriptional regulator n=1 Tax=Streptomyces pseudogriseolus TaxID=36817 RepID=UPI00346E97A5
MTTTVPAGLDAQPRRISRRWVYVIGSPVVRPVKIGVSDDPEERLEDLQTGSPVPLVLLWQVHGGQRLESLLHERFTAYRTHGEWFDFGDDDPILTVAEEAARLGYGPLPVVPLPRQPITPAPRPTRRVKQDTVRGRLLAALADGPATPRDLAHQIGIDRRAVYRPIERLVTQGHAAWLPDGRVTVTEAPTAEPEKKTPAPRKKMPIKAGPPVKTSRDRVLDAVRAASGPIRQKDVVRALGISPGTVSKAVSALLAAGLLARLDDGAVAAQ